MLNVLPPSSTLTSLAGVAAITDVLVKAKLVTLEEIDTLRAKYALKIQEQAMSALSADTKDRDVKAAADFLGILMGSR